jgi:hypothetical protein
MKYVKPLQVFEPLEEMAKSWPVGTVVKCEDVYDCSKSSYGNKWNSWRPTVAEKIQDPSFYMKITESGRSWLIGKILYTNGLIQYVSTDDRFRFRTIHASLPTSEYKIIEKNKEEIQQHIGKVFFIEGDEVGIMGNDGGKTFSVTSSEYVTHSLNFKLTDLYNEPVFLLFSKNSPEKNFSIKLSDLKKLSRELSKEQREVISEWFSKQFSCIMEPLDEKFKIFLYEVVASYDNVFKSFSAGPFMNKAQAESYLENLKKEKITPFNPAKLKVKQYESWSNHNLKMDIEELIEFAKASGLKISMKELLNIKRGTVIGKKFGL